MSIGFNLSAKGLINEDSQKEIIHEDEIDLLDIFRTLWRWKKMIIGITLACTRLAFGICSFLPKIYEVNAIIEPGTRLYYNKDGQVTENKAIEVPASIRETILGGAFNKEIAEKLALKRSDIPKIKVKIPNGTNLLLISLERLGYPERARLVPHTQMGS